MVFSRSLEHQCLNRILAKHSHPENYKLGSAKNDSLFLTVVLTYCSFFFFLVLLAMSISAATLTPEGMTIKPFALSGHNLLYVVLAEICKAI